MEDATPTDGGQGGRSRSRTLFALAAFVVVVAGMKAAAPILVRVALAGFVVVITRPAVAWLQRRRVPSALAITLVVLAVFGLGAVFVSLAAQSLGQLSLQVPRYTARARGFETRINDWLQTLNLPVPERLHFDFVNAERALTFATGAAREAASVTSALVLIMIITVFGMIEANGLPEKLRRAFGERADLVGMQTVTAEMQHYLAIKTVVSLMTGLLVGGWVAIVGLDFPVFWGLVAFVLNYVPNVGSIIAAVPAIVLAWLDLGFDAALLTSIGYVAINMVLGNMVEPTWLGRRLGLSPLIVMLSLVFWGWLWGAIGVLLAVPLTMSARIMLEKTRYSWVAVLLAPTSETVAAGHGEAGPGEDGAGAGGVRRRAFSFRRR
jgi:AI-2 transport protein TqsA